MDSEKLRIQFKHNDGTQFQNKNTAQEHPRVFDIFPHRFSYIPTLVQDPTSTKRKRNLVCIMSFPLHVVQARCWHPWERISHTLGLCCSVCLLFQCIPAMCFNQRRGVAELMNIFSCSSYVLYVWDLEQEAGCLMRKDSVYTRVLFLSVSVPS